MDTFGKKFRVAVFGVLILVIVVKCQSNSGPCRTIYLHGQEMSFPGDAGFYSLLNTRMNGRPTYIDDAGQEPLYLFYGVYDTEVGGYWVISANMNNILTGTRVEDNATLPEMIQAEWEELYRDDTGNLVWKKNPTIKAECIDTGCVTGRLFVGSFNEISHPLQVNLQGIYGKQSEIHNLKPVYKHIYSNWYIYYNTDRNEDNTTFSYWAIGRSIGSDLISVIATVNAPDPSFISGSWRIYSNTRDSFVDAEQFSTKCVASHSDYCRTGELLLTIDGELPFLAGSLPLHDDLQMYIQDTVGVYHLLNATHNSRPVYKHVEKDYFLFFISNRANGYSGWVIGRLLGSELGHILFLEDNALRPELITVTEWGYIDILSASVLPTLINSNKIKLSCKGSIVEATDTNCTTVCYNGATCQIQMQFEQGQFKNVTHCLCQDGYYGKHCEQRISCPAPPVKINNGTLIEHVHEGDTYLSLALYLCGNEYTMAVDHYFAVCGRNGAWENIPRCIEEPNLILLDTVHLASKGEDSSSCGNKSQPCQTLKYSFSRITDGGTIFVHGTINQCGSQTLTGKTVTIEAWEPATEEVSFNCNIGENFLTLEESKTTLRNVVIKGGVIFISGTNKLHIMESTLLNTVIANGGIYSEEIQLIATNSVWENTLPCHDKGAAMLYLSVLRNIPICDTFSRIDLTPAGVNNLFVHFNETSFYGTILNIGGQLSTNINVDRILFTNVKSGEKQTRKFMNIIIASGISSVNFTRSIFRDIVFEDTRGQDLFQQSALVLQEYVLTDRSDNSFVIINLLNCTFMSNTRGMTIQLSSHAQVNIIDSTFIDNMAQGGGGAIRVTLGRLNQALDVFNIDIFSLFGWNNNQVSVTVSHCTFTNNTAITDAILQNPGRGGALFVDATLELTIFQCTFLNNSARLLGGSIYSGPQASVILSDTQLTSSASNEHVLLGEILYIQGFMYIENISLIGEVTNNHVPLLSYLGNAKLGNSFALIKSINLTCPVSHSVKLENASHPYVNFGYEHIHYSCVSCPDGTYSTRGGSYWTEAEIPDFVFRHRELINITTVTNRNTSIADIDCKPCPYGGFCQHGLKSRRNFWGYENMNEVHFQECQPGHGCNKEYCEKYDECYQNRKGFLCSECEDGYSETFSGSDCVNNEHCNNDWIWGLVGLYGVLYVLFLLFEHEWKSFWHSQTSWCYNHFIQKCFKKTAGSANREHKERGLLRIFIYYVQVGVLLQLEILYQSKMPQSVKSFQDSIAEIVNFNVAPLHNNLCIMPGWDKVARLAYRGVFVLYLFVALSLLYPIWLLLTRLCKYTGKLKMNIRFLVVFLELLLFTYQAVTEISLVSIECVQVGSEEVLSIKGSIQCFQAWQYGIIFLIILYVAPLFLVMLLGPSSLVAGILPWPLFMVSCVCPILFFIAYPVLLIKNKSKAQKAISPDPQSTAVIVADKISGPYKTVFGLCCWEGVIVLQRFILGIIAATSSDMLVKHFLLSLVNLLILLLHVIVRPFKEKSSNIVDITSLLFLSVLSLISLVKSVLYKVGVIPVGQLQSIYYALENINFILLVILPFVLIILVLSFCLIHTVLRLAFCVRKNFKANTKDGTPEENSHSLNSSDKKNEHKIEDTGNDDNQSVKDQNGYASVPTTQDEAKDQNTSV